MRFIQSNLAKKLIIVLIVILLFNTICPSMSYAVDLGGILLQPVYWLLLGIYIPADLSLGLTIFMKEFVTNDLDGWIEGILDGDYNGLEISYGKSLRDWFIGPDTIFSRTYPIA